MIHSLRPLRIHLSPFFSARVWSPKASEPDDASDSAYAPTFSLVSWIGGSYLLRWVLTVTAQDSHSIYGPLAAPIAILIWLYIVALAVLIGAGVNAAFDEVFPQEATQRARRELMARLLRRTPDPVE